MNSLPTPLTVLSTGTTRFGSVIEFVAAVVAALNRTSFAVGFTVPAPFNEIFRSCAFEEAFTIFRYTIPFAGSRVTV